MNIHPSQVVLIVVLTLFILYIFWLRTVLIERLIYILFAIGGIFLVIDPDSTSQIAHLLGIGRGTDLLIYLFILASLFYMVNLRSQLKGMREQLTLVVQQLALQNPINGSFTPPELNDQITPQAQDSQAKPETLQKR